MLDVGALRSNVLIVFDVVAYQFNGRNEKVKSQSSRLTMIADKPGNLTIISVGDQRNKCRSFPKDMTKIVHEIPSSLVSGGKEIIENIREGNISVFCLSVSF